MKSVMIDERLFNELVRYFCFGSEYADADFIQQSLEEKVSKLAARERYAKALLGDKETAP